MNICYFVSNILLEVSGLYGKARMRGNAAIKKKLNICFLANSFIVNSFIEFNINRINCLLIHSEKCLILYEYF